MYVHIIEVRSWLFEGRLIVGVKELLLVKREEEMEY